MEGQTPLHLAVMQCDAEILRILVEAGADINVKNASFFDEGGDTPWDIAVEKCGAAIVRILGGR